MIRRFLIALILAFAAGIPAAAQSVLSLQDALARARAQNPAAAGSAAAEREAAQRVTQARAAYWPRVDVTESWQRSNQPVFVFSSLLSQRRFTAENFALPALNHPDAIDNFRASVMAEQAVFNPGAKAGLNSAAIGRDIATARRSIVDRNLAVEITGAYGRVLAAAAARQSASAALEAANADRERAVSRRDTGLITEADVLQIDVQVARSREQQIRSALDERTARAELNRLIGEPLDATFTLDRGPAAASIDTSNLADLQAQALASRPEVTVAALEERLASEQISAAQGDFLPTVAALGGWEFNGGTWTSRSSSWVVGAVARINVFQGFASKARLAEARERLARRSFERREAEDAVRLDVYVSAARVDAARAREAVGRAAVAQARENRRIVRDRYEAGLADITALLRATESVVQAETQQATAEVALITETAALARALGRQ